jgi:gp21
MIQDIIEGVKEKKELADINKAFIDKGDYKSVSDGYHTIGDLYEHRTYLFAMICKLYIPTVYVWKTKKHEDGTMYDDMFLVGIDLPNGQISYHIKNKYWDLFNEVKEIEHASEYDGYTSEDVITRMGDYIKNV